MQHIQFITLATLLPFISVLTATLVLVLRSIGTSKASMDPYTQFYNRDKEHERSRLRDEAYHWLEGHEKVCPKTMGGMTKEDGITTVHRICPVCAEAQQNVWGIKPIRTPEMVMPDFVDPRKAAKEVFARIPISREQAA